MNENLKKLAEFISAQDEETIKKVTKMEAEELIAYAAENGITVTAEELEEAEKEVKERAAKKEEGELSDDELDAVAGGAVCACAVGGGGKGGKHDETCGCFVAGWGEEHNYHGWYRCWCVVGGGGKTCN